MKINDILKHKGTDVITVNENDDICTAIELFKKKKIGSCIVKNDQGEIVGIITEKDVIKCYQGVIYLSEIDVKELMTKSQDLIIASKDDDIQYAIAIMTEHRIKHLPIFDNTKLCGIISIGDLIKAKMEQSTVAAKSYLDYILGKVPQPDNEEF